MSTLAWSYKFITPRLFSYTHTQAQSMISGANFQDPSHRNALDSESNKNATDPVMTEYQKTKFLITTSNAIENYTSENTIVTI